ncbi:hypothetical protein ABMA28_009036 [Loxostege sticticalis]|uniref:Uncharacterized protein n=1 Tax=Loxostege sticticalis TaxID=481309 RepID=A0ABD0SHS1_LOXSC
MTSLHKTPPKATLLGESGSRSVGGSTPNLSALDIEEYVNINSRKRKERSHDQDYKQDFAAFQAEIMSFFENFAKTQNENISKISTDISEIKEEMKSMKAVTENLTQKLNNVCCEMQEIKTEYAKTKEKITLMENDIFQIRENQQTQNQTPKSLISSNEDIISELKDRNDREKNIIIVGIPENNNKNSAARRAYDHEMVTKTIAVCYDNVDIVRHLLRNKSKLPESLKLYSDQTPSQKIYLQTVIEELKRREDAGESDLTIKYNKGIPKIVKTKIPPKN